MPIRDLKDQIARLPQQPGVYLYFNKAGDTIYVGGNTNNDVPTLKKNADG